MDYSMAFLSIVWILSVFGTIIGIISDNQKMGESFGIAFVILSIMMIVSSYN